MTTDGSALAMRPRKVESFLRRPIIAVLSWTTKSGEPMSTPVWFEYSGGKFFVYTTSSTGKARAIRRTGRVCLCVQYSTPPHQYVTVRGDARIIDDPKRATQLMERLARKYLGRLGGSRFQEVGEENEAERIIVEVTPTEIRSLDTAAVINPVLLAVWNLVRRIPGL